MKLRIYYNDNALWIDTIPTSFVAGTLAAVMSDDGVTVRITPKDGALNHVSPPWADIAAQDGSAFSTPADVMAHRKASSPSGGP